MRRFPALTALAAVLVIGPALQASAIEAAFSGRAFLKYKEVYEDGDKDKMKFEYDDAVVDTSSSISANITLDVGIGAAYSVLRKNDRKGVVVPALDPETDFTATETLINALGGVGMADVHALKFKFGFQKINKKFKKNHFELKLKGTYQALDGPRVGEDVRFVLFIQMPKGKRLAF
jgi:hypothetical protein